MAKYQEGRQLSEQFKSRDRSQEFVFSVSHPVDPFVAYTRIVEKSRKLYLQDLEEQSKKPITATL